MKPINPGKFAVNSIIWLRNLIFREGTPRPLKGYHAPPAGGPGGEGPPDGSEFSFFKRFKVFENEFFFQKCQHFSSPKDPFFLRKI